MRAQLAASGYRRLLTLLFTFLLPLCASSPSYSFDMSIHDDITSEQLQNNGFDEDSADEAADSNFYTDLFEPTNAAAHADNNALGAASGRLTEKRNLIATSLAACKRRKALDTLGEALHTVQDVYSHSNSVDNGHAIPDLFGMADGSAACSPPNFAPGGLVTGYFSLSGYATGDQCSGTPAGWCCHRDLNKDNGGVPNGARHPAAAGGAAGATLQYVGNVESHIRDTYPSDQAEQMIKMLKRKQRTHYFVIDDTGSMGSDIAGVKAAVHSIVDSLIASDEAPTLGLVSFKDSPTMYGDFCDLEQFRNRVNTLFPSGGGDCPEASNSGMLAAINQFPPSDTDVRLKGGRVLLATDASAGDASLGPIVAAEANSKGVSIDAILTGDCVAETASLYAPIALAPTALAASSMTDIAAAGLVLAAVASDPLTSPSARTQLRALTAATGGVLFQVTRAEVGQVVPTLLDLSSPDSATLLTRRLTLPGTPVTLDIPVDETLTNSVTFMVALSRPGSLPALTIIRPDGSTVSPTDPGVRRLALSSVNAYTISTPTTGLWRMQLTGTSSVIARAYGGSTLDVNALRFIEPAPAGSRPEVEFVPLEGQPIVGASVTADLRLTARPTVSEVRLLREDGTLLQSLVPLTMDRRYFRINFTVPAEPFLIHVLGTSPGSNAFSRQISVPVTPQTVAISVNPKSVSASPGTSAAVQVTVRNLSGAEATYQLQARSSLNWTVSVPSAFTIPAGGSTTVTVTVQVPSNAPEGAESDLALLVQDTAVATTRNNTRATVRVVTNQPPVCTTASAQPNVLWPPNHALVPVQIGGVTDPDGDPVTISVTGITQDEPVNEVGDGDTTPDATGVGSDTPSVRAERSGTGDGRVYAIGFSATDDQGAQCQGTVSVTVPHNKSGAAIDSGQLYDSM